MEWVKGIVLTPQEVRDRIVKERDEARAVTINMSRGKIMRMIQEAIENDVNTIEFYSLGMNPLIFVPFAEAGYQLKSKDGFLEISWE